MSEPGQVGQSRPGNTATDVRQVIVGPVQGIGAVSWSPDGSWIAYDAVPFGGSTGDDPTAPPGPHAVSELWLVHPDGSGRHRLAVIDGFGGKPRWSPDGSHLSSSLYNDRRILVADIAAGTEQRFVADQPYLTSWSPDGTRLAWSSDPFPDPKAATSIMDASTGVSTEICGDCYFPRWSPTGEWLAVRRGGQTQVIGPDGSLGPTFGAGSPLDWSSDGRSFDFTETTYELRVADVSTGAVRVIATAGPGNALSPTGWVPGTRMVAIIDSGHTAWYSP